MLYALQTLPGLGELAWLEAQRRLGGDDGQPPKLVGMRAVPGRNDLVLIDHRGGPRPLLTLRTSEDAFVVAARGFKVAPDARGLRQIHAAVYHSDSAEAAVKLWRRASGFRPQGVSFRVIARMVGTQKFMRREVGRAVADAVKDGWPGRWTLVEDDADLEIWATLVEHELFCTLRLSDASMRQRSKTYHLPASLRPALAAAMVGLTDPEVDDVFLDPMAGAGTILVERAAAGKFAEIHGGDISGEALRAMQENLHGVRGEIYVSRWDARKLPLDDASVDKVAVNLPFGKQVSEEAELPGLYREVLAELVRVVRPGGRVVVLTGDYRLLETARNSAARRLRPGPRHRVIVLGQAATICEFTRGN
ncbi:THUMP domain-containing class I SAM-dependent methyltransferase [Candidatus Chloroploca sp. Khr17]|uniref:THUMP domain-containing class I SAM-dependent methyltransferase n=1 Tax=Candidatus Chloroploca sp. Khr17 TaxID=2496869 RepID=UPI00101DCEFE|nr:methyltransferase domain-containing protein [Candidatus Chloroploca sp. Khr17]